MKTITMLLSALPLVALALPAQAAGDPKAGRLKSSMCAGCHGIPGWRTAYPSVYSVPKLGGQHAEYIVAALQAYKSGERNHPTMNAIARGLTDEDKADLAAYYASSYSGLAR